MTTIRQLFIDEAKFGKGTAKGPWFGELPVPRGGDFDFAFISDRTGGAVHKMFEKGLEAAKKLNPDFVVSIGDLVEGYWTDEAEAREEWDRIDPMLAGLGVPVFQTVGNHDYGTEAMIRVWRERKGVDYYAFRYGRTLFLVANTETAPLSLPETMLELMQQANRALIRNPEALFVDLFRDLAGDGFSADVLKMTEDTLIDPHLSGEQIDFFERVLADNADVDWTFVCLHQPAWKKPDPIFERLESLLADRPYTVVSGHVHYLEVTEKRGRQYIQMGKTGGLHCFEGKGDIHHILSVKMRGGVPRFEVILLEGEGGTDTLDAYVKKAAESR
ncbi:metallophosphoesterase family protein [Cohnella algarum]|uniref:metallophosphoesterase family protein n=1 Tax=Cohnella algarum TaxID=2044859 RepID=UPI001967CEF7|nr:metallophosphoesterase [Cohnella algarum]MBN2980782.1 metallophosphoesterase [Cohnella algarum]